MWRCANRHFGVTVPVTTLEKILDTFYPLLVFVLVTTNQNLFESKESSRIKTIKYHATTNIFSLLSAHDAHKQRENICYCLSDRTKQSMYEFESNDSDSS